MTIKFESHLANEDNVLFLLIKKRDKDAFTAVYRKYHSYLYALAFKYLKSTEMAEDAVQQVFVKLWETSAKIQIEINLKNYLYTMVKNYILNQFRNQRESISLNYINSQAIISKDNFTEEFEERELHKLLYHEIEKLPPQKRKICQLKLDEKLSNQEIADQMNVSINTVKSHYQESIKILREQLKKIN